MPLTLKKGEIVVAVLKNQSYSKDIVKIASQLCTKCKATVYVSLNRPYGPLTSSLKKSKVDTSKILFIDGISKSAGQEVKEDNCLLIESAGALTKISLVVNKAVKTGKFDGLVFDSLSTLLIYNKKEVVSKFVQSMVNKLRAAKMTVIFTALKGDTETGLLKEISMFVDEVVEM